MKRVVAVILFVVMALSLCACSSEEERALESANERLNQAQKDYNDAVDDYNDFKNDVDDYQQALDRVNSYK